MSDQRCTNLEYPLTRCSGYDTGVISAVLVSLQDDLGHVLSSKEQELVTSITSGGALIGALIAGIPADRFGRKLGIYVGCILFFIGSVIQAAAYSVAQMTIGRFIVGLGVGSAAMIIVSSQSLDSMCKVLTALSRSTSENWHLLSSVAK